MVFLVIQLCTPYPLNRNPAVPLSCLRCCLIVSALTALQFDVGGGRDVSYKNTMWSYTIMNFIEEKNWRRGDSE